jgi:hypothetical protein
MEEEQDVSAARQELMARKETALQGLNMRIARLAIALGLELDTDVGLRMALEPGLTPHQRPFLDELRGLLTLRYQMEKQFVDEVGNQLTHQIVAEVEQHMERIGFKHGMDGNREGPLVTP